MASSTQIGTPDPDADKETVKHKRKRSYVFKLNIQPGSSELFAKWDACVPGHLKRTHYQWCFTRSLRGLPFTNRNLKDSVQRFRKEKSVEEFVELLKTGSLHDVYNDETKRVFVRELMAVSPVVPRPASAVSSPSPVAAHPVSTPVSAGNLHHLPHSLSHFTGYLPKV